MSALLDELHNRSAALLLLLMLIAVVAVWLLPFRATNLIPRDSAWTSNGCFKPGAVYPTTQFDKSISARERRDVALWGSWCGSDATTGELLSSPFEAPGILELFVAGYPGSPGLAILLQREDNHARVPLLVRQDLQPREHWRKLHWRIPATIRGHQVRLIAVDSTSSWGGWLGIGTPRRLSFLGLLRQQASSALLTIFLFILDFALFLLPGFALAATLRAKRPLSALAVIVLVIATSATLGYISFWAFFFAKLFGRIFSFAVYLSSASMLVLALRRNIDIKTTAKLVVEPFCYVALAGLCYICFFFLFINPAASGATHADERFFDQIRPGDNVIPLIFAEKIYGRKPLRPFCCGEWLSSDRPPLQSGIFLLQRPLRLVGSIDLNYELLAAALQCLWICGVWCLLKSLGASTFRIRQVLGLLIFSGFLFYNSVYTWPKLLGAACLLLAFSIVVEAIRAKRAMTYFEIAIAAACLGLALMAHPGTVFSLLALAVTVLRFRHLFPLRQAAFAVLVVCAFGLPWVAYQKFVDPPGNRLLKMHLAGEIDIDGRSTWQAVRDAYRGHTLSQITHLKLSNIILLAGQKPLDTFGLGDFSVRDGPHLDRAATESSRVAQREWIWNAVGLLNVGWLAALWLLFWRNSPRPAIPFSGWILAAALSNLLFWALVTFAPKETVTTHSSYADILLLSIGLLGFVLTLPGFVLLALLALQVFNFFVVWICSPPHTRPAAANGILTLNLQFPLLIFGGLLTLALLWHFGRNYLERRPSEEPAPVLGTRRRETHSSSLP